MSPRTPRPASAPAMTTRAMTPKLTFERARELLRYCPKTGLLTWNTRAGARGQPGTVAGRIDKKGYIYVGVDGSGYFGHRVAWLLHTGQWPKQQIDHINGEKSDNRFSNLRDITATENVHNQHGARKRNVTGMRGVSRNHTKFQAEILANGVRLYLGSFDTPEEAHSVYLQAKQELHPSSRR